MICDHFVWPISSIGNFHAAWLLHIQLFDTAGVLCILHGDIRKGGVTKALGCLRSPITWLFKIWSSLATKTPLRLRYWTKCHSADNIQNHFIYDKFVLISKIPWCLFPRNQVTFRQHQFRELLGAEQATSHYQDQWWYMTKCNHAIWCHLAAMSHIFDLETCN